LGRLLWSRLAWEKLLTIETDFVTRLNGMFSRSSERVRSAEVAVEAAKVRHEQETRIHDELILKKRGFQP
jgi:hypothetical protein